MKSAVLIKILVFVFGGMLVVSGVFFVVHKTRRVNPLLAKSNEVFHFLFDWYARTNNDWYNPSNCYTKGGWIPNAEIKEQLLKTCRKHLKQYMNFAHKQGYFMDSQLSDWMDQDLLKKINDENIYCNNHGCTLASLKNNPSNAVPDKFKPDPTFAKMGRKAEIKLYG